MASILTAYGSSNSSITITLTTLADSAARQSTAIDNSTNLFLDALVFLKLKSGASSVSATGVANIYAFGTADGGTTYTEGAGASDAAITLVSPTNLRFVGSVNMVANATIYDGGPFSIAAAFNGVLPQKWGIVVENKTGAAFDGSVASAWYQGVYSSVA